MYLSKQKGSIKQGWFKPAQRSVRAVGMDVQGKAARLGTDGTSGWRSAGHVLDRATKRAASQHGLCAGRGSWRPYTWRRRFAELGPKGAASAALST